MPVTGSNQYTREITVIDFNKTRQYTLSIRLSAGGFCFAVHNPQTPNEYAFQPYSIDPLKTLTNNLKTAVVNTEMLKHTYGAVNIILADTSYTLVPKEFYDEQYKEEFYRQNISTPITGSVIMHNFVGDEQLAVIFAIEKQLHRFITNRWAKAQVYASISPIISFGIERSYTSGKKYNLLHLHKHGIDFMCYENTTPLFVNTFQYKDSADALFYLLNSWTSLSLSQTDDTLHIAGQSRHGKSLIREIKKFIQNIHLVRPAEEFHSTELARIDEMPFDLQALIACE